MYDDFNIDLEIEKALKQAETVEQYRKIIKIAIGKWLNNLQSGEIKLNSISDLKVLIEADLMLKDIEN